MAVLRIANEQNHPLVSLSPSTWISSIVHDVWNLDATLGELGSERGGNLATSFVSLQQCNEQIVVIIVTKAIIGCFIIMYLFYFELR